MPSYKGRRGLAQSPSGMAAKPVQNLLRNCWLAGIQPPLHPGNLSAWYSESRSDFLSSTCQRHSRRPGTGKRHAEAGARPSRGARVLLSVVGLSGPLRRATFHKTDYANPDLRC
jgi:hypothetical protein